MQTISCERKELEKILRMFNIYVDNPCCVLTQEESKKFIQGQEKQKYEFFLKVSFSMMLTKSFGCIVGALMLSIQPSTAHGHPPSYAFPQATGLERTKEELAKSEDLMKAIEGDLARTKAGLQGKKDAQDVLKKELQDLMSLDLNEGEIRNCLAKLEWIDIHALDDVLRELDNESELKSNELEKAKIAKAIAESNETENGGNVEAINVKVKEFQDQLTVIVADVDQKKLAVKRKNAEISAVQTDMKLVTMNKAENNSRLRQARSEVTIQCSVSRYGTMPFHSNPA